MQWDLKPCEKSFASFKFLTDTNNFKQIPVIISKDLNALHSKLKQNHLK